MKVLVMYVDEFGYTPQVKKLESAEEITEGATFSDAILAFIQEEESDEEKDVKIHLPDIWPLCK